MTTMKNGNPINIKLATTVVQEGTEEKHNFDVAGFSVEKGGHTYLRYEETHQVEGNQLTVPVTIKLASDGMVHLTRTAAGQRMKFVFSEVEPTITHYATPYGMMPLMVKTIAMRRSVENEGTSGTLVVDYELYQDEEKVGDYNLNLVFSK